MSAKQHNSAKYWPQLILERVLFARTRMVTQNTEWLVQIENDHKHKKYHKEQKNRKLS